MAAPVCFRGNQLRAAKRFMGATQRTVSPEETLERIRPYFRAAGLTRLADVTGLDRIGIPTAIAYRPNSPTLSTSAGKGFTLAAACASGAMEAIELFHAENVRLPAVRASLDELTARGLAIPGDRLNLSKHSLFRPGLQEFWVLGWDLVSQREIAVPHSAVGMVPHAGRRPAMLAPFQTGSNGLASGNHPLEAICAALLEVIERDALACDVAGFKAGGHPHTRVALDTIACPMVIDLLQRFDAAHIGVLLYDVRVDTAVPVYSAKIYDRLDRHVGVYSGFGAHLDPAVAMVRALTEAAQSRLIYIAGARDDYFRHDYFKHRMSDSGDHVRSLEAVAPSVDASELASEATGSFEGDIAVLCGKLGRCDLHHVIAFDLTHEEIGIPVVRVIVPGLESYPHHLHYAPGPRAVAAGRAVSGHSGDRPS